MTKLSVNVNKIATLRNARGGNVPDLLKVTGDLESFGAQGITIHPRPDERHIRYQDARDLKNIVKTEFNIEGNPIPKFIDLVLDLKPEQVLQTSWYTNFYFCRSRPKNDSWCKCSGHRPNRVIYRKLCH